MNLSTNLRRSSTTVFSRWLTVVAGLAGVVLLTKAGDLRTPVIFPDYSGTVIPPNIAPLNFIVEQPAGPVRATIRGQDGEAIAIKGRRQCIQIPARAWRKLPEANRGKNLRLEIQVKNTAGEWENLAPLTNAVAKETMDGYLVYRLLKPLYNYYSELGIYQRNLENFEEVPVLQNTSFGRGCLNCHTFLNNEPSRMAIQIRHQASGNPLLLVISNEVFRVARTSGYSSWHPSGRLIAYSANKLSLFFHTAGECRDVSDTEGTQTEEALPAEGAYPQPGK